MASARDPRKLPGQERSHATVDAILTAVEQLSASGGVEELKVSAIAKRAGVTLGTFYQYYSGMDSVLAAWEERELERDKAEFLARVAYYSEHQPPYEEVVKGLVELCFDVFWRRRAFYKTPAGADFLSRRRARTQLVDATILIMASALESAPDQHRLYGPNYAPMLRIVVKAATNIAFDTAVSALSDDEVASIRSETVKMITRYVIRDPVIPD
jgi:AcrR family transcriptional regulator